MRIVLTGLILLGWGWMAGSLAFAQAQTNPWTLLATPDSELRGNIVGCEQVIDMVEATVSDSMITKAKQRLNGFGGWFIQATWARYWTYFTDHKQKYVGSMSRNYHVFDGPSDELDINIFIMPHLQRYIKMVREGFDQADARNRPDKGFRIDSLADYPLPEELYFEKERGKGRGYLTIECEVTPPLMYMEHLQDAVFPVEEGDYRMDTVPNWGTLYPSVGMTGPWCMDCNHNCRPEIHPMEWLWWLDMSPNRPGSPNAKSWMVTLMVDGSRRFRDWTPSPIIGEIAIPITAPAGSNMRLDLQQLIADGVEGALAGPGTLDAYQTGDTTFTRTFTSEREIYPALEMRIQTSGGWSPKGLRYWFTGVHATDDGWQGYLHIAARMESMLAMRVTVDSVPAH